MELQEPKIKARDRRAVRSELVKIKQANADELLVAEEVVEAAKDEDNPLHAWFNWDDTEAAHQYRLMQARALIRTVEVILPDDKEERAVPKYLSLISDRHRVGGGYRETRQVLSNKKLLAELEETCKRDIDGVLQRYEMLKALCAKVRRTLGIKRK